VFGEILGDAAIYTELIERFPNGPEDRPDNAHVVRQVVQVMRDRLRSMGIMLLLRCDPPGENTRPPTRLFVRDGTLAWGLPLEAQATYCVIDGRTVVTNEREDAVMRVVHAICNGLTRLLNPSNE
jgi:hypothetical protein